MEFSAFADIIVVIRDFLVILLLVLVFVVLLCFYLKVSRLLDSMRRTTKSMEDVWKVISDGILGSASAGSGIAYGAGKVTAFLMGLKPDKKKNGDGGKTDGEQ